MVIFRSPDGKPGYHQAETLEEAVGFVERLRNQDGVSDARVFRMDEVAIEFKVYYRVAVAGEDPTSVTEPAPADVTAEPVVSELTDAPLDGPADDEMASNGAGNAGRFGLFSRA